MKLSSMRAWGAIMALAGAALAAAPQFAHAAEPGFYVAGFYGQANIPVVDKAVFDDFADFVYSQYRFTPSTRDSRIGDDSDSSFGMYAGYRIFTNLAVEGGYIDLGEISYRNDSFGTHVDHQEPWFQKQTASTSGIALTVLGVLPISYRWELYARAGVLFATNEIDLYVTDFVTGSDSIHLTDSSTETLAGVGASFAFAEVYSARFEFKRIFGLGDGLIEGDLDVVSVGVAVAF